MKKKGLIFLLLILAGSIACTEIAGVLAGQRSGVYLVGEGRDLNKNKADEKALQDLTSQIMVDVRGSFESVAIESGVSVDEYCKRVVKTYSNVQLSGALKICDKDPQSGEEIVYRYIRAEEKDRMFKDREKLITHLVIEGELAFEKGNIVDAMRNYYWALVNLQSHPDARRMTYYFRGKNSLLNIALVNELETILNEIKISLESMTQKSDSNYSDLIFNAKYKGNLVNGLLVKHYDEYAWQPAALWGNGIEYISLNNNVIEALKRVKFQIDYTFANHKFTGYIENTIDNIPAIHLNNAEKQVVIDSRKRQQLKSTRANYKYDSEIRLEHQRVMNDILTAIDKKELNSVRSDFTLEGFSQFNDLMGYGNATIIPTNNTIKQVKIKDDTILRSVPMKFDFTNSQEPFTEEVNFVLNKEGKVDGITFAISEIACGDIVNKDYASDEEKILIVNFIEQYKTAYCLKNLDFIENVFSNDALIIVGRMVKVQPDKFNDQLYEQLSQTEVKYVKLNKAEYVKRIKKQFSKKEFINIRFKDNTVTRVQSEGDKIFGIQISQYYYSSDYRDNGYLFLMFDLHDIDNPKIMVRSWQPEKNADGSIIGLDVFRFEN